jgi:hypothetical protein
MFALSALIHYGLYFMLGAALVPSAGTIKTSDFLALLFLMSGMLYPAFLLYHLVVWAMLRGIASKPRRIAVYLGASFLAGVIAVAVHGERSAAMVSSQPTMTFLAGLISALLSLAICLGVPYKEAKSMPRPDVGPRVY